MAAVINVVASFKCIMFLSNNLVRAMFPLDVYILVLTE